MKNVRTIFFFFLVGFAYTKTGSGLDLVQGLRFANLWLEHGFWSQSWVWILIKTERLWLKQRVTDVENNLMFTQEKRLGGVNWETG